VRGARGNDEVAGRKHLQVALELTAALEPPPCLALVYMHLNGPGETELFAQGHVRIPLRHRSGNWVGSRLSQPFFFFSLSCIGICTAARIDLQVRFS
jgi:hypothetical protein